MQSFSFIQTYRINIKVNFPSTPNPPRYFSKTPGDLGFVKKYQHLPGATTVHQELRWVAQCGSPNNVKKSSLNPIYPEDLLRASSIRKLLAHCLHNINLENDVLMVRHKQTNNLDQSLSFISKIAAKI